MPEEKSSSALWIAIGCFALLALGLGGVVVLGAAGGVSALLFLRTSPDEPPEPVGIEPVTASSAPAVPPASGSAPPAAYQGAWTFGEDCGKTAGGTPIYVAHTLTLTGDKATATANGYQTWLEVTGTLYPVGTDTWDLHVDTSDGTAPKPAGTVVMRIDTSKKRLQVDSSEWPFACAEGPVKFQREK